MHHEEAIREPYQGLFDNFILALQNLEQGIDPMGQDPGVKAFASAMQMALAYPRFRETLTTIFTVRREDERMRPAYRANLLLRTLQKQALKDPPITSDRFPHDFGDELAWFNLVRTISDNPTLRGEFMGDNLLLDVKSNKQHRYKASKMVALLFQDRVGANPRKKDIGCSENLGLKMEFSGLPFSKITVVEPVGDSETEFRVNPESTERANKLLEMPAQPGPSLGVDIEEPSLALRNFIRACSFYPMENLDEKKVAEFIELENSPMPDNLSFLRMDYAQPHLAPIPGIMEEHSIDMCLYFAMLYMLDTQRRVYAIENGDRYTKEDGLGVFSDFGRPNSNDPTGVSFFKDWSDWTFRTLIRDPGDKKNRWEELFIWKNGRCDVLLNTAKLEAILPD